MVLPGNLLRLFPNLNPETAAKKSEATPKYNCIAFAASDVDECWWPSDDGFWPDGIAREETLGAFVAAFETLGYELCAAGNLEAGVEKIAIYAIGDAPSHAARQLHDGTWVSKLGALEDIQHETLAELDGTAYGRVVSILKRAVSRLGQ
jgi:hypothetical protein